MSNLNLADIIKEKRNELGISLKELSAITDLSSSYLNRLENMRVPSPTIDTIVKLLLALKIEPSIIPNLSTQEIELINKEYILASKKNEILNNNDLDKDNSVIAGLIKNKRKELGLSLKDLEKITGISASYINRLETNSRNRPSIEIIKKLSIALNLDMGKLPGILQEAVSNSNNIIEIIRKENLSYNGINLSIPQKNKLCNVIDYLLNCKWNDDSKIEDIKLILDLVNILKKEKL